MKLVLVLSALGSSILRRKKREKKVVGGWVMIINLARSAMAHEKQIKREKERKTHLEPDLLAVDGGKRRKKFSVIKKFAEEIFSCKC